MFTANCERSKLIIKTTTKDSKRLCDLTTLKTKQNKTKKGGIANTKLKTNFNMKD